MKNKMKISGEAGVALAAFGLLGGLVLAGRPASAALITNGGFETGDLTGWTQSGNVGFTFVAGDSHTGSHAAWLGAQGFPGYLEQDLITTPGEKYELGFFLSNDGQPNTFETYIDGVTVFSAVNLPDQPYTPYSVAFTATGHSTNLKFGFTNEPDYLRLDDVSVTAVPEPGLLAFGLVAGGSLLGLLARRRRG